MGKARVLVARAKFWARVIDARITNERTIRVDTDPASHSALIPRRMFADYAMAQRPDPTNLSDLTQIEALKFMSWMRGRKVRIQLQVVDRLYYGKWRRYWETTVLEILDG